MLYDASGGDLWCGELDWQVAPSAADNGKVGSSDGAVAEGSEQSERRCCGGNCSCKQRREIGRGAGTNYEEVVGSGCKSHPCNDWKAHPCMCQCQSYARADGAVGNCLMLPSTYMWRSSSS